MKKSQSTLLRAFSLLVIFLGMGTLAYMGTKTTTTPPPQTPETQKQIEQKTKLDSQGWIFNNKNIMNLAGIYNPSTDYYFHQTVKSKNKPDNSNCISPCTTTNFSCANGRTVSNKQTGNFYSTVSWKCKRETYNIDCSATCPDKKYWDGTGCVSRDPNFCKQTTASSPQWQCVDGYRSENLTDRNGVKCSVGDPWSEISDICCNFGYTLNNGKCEKGVDPSNNKGKWSCEEATTIPNKCEGSYETKKYTVCSYVLQKKMGTSYEGTANELCISDNWNKECVIWLKYAGARDGCKTITTNKWIDEVYRQLRITKPFSSKKGSNDYKLGLFLFPHRFNTEIGKVSDENFPVGAKLYHSKSSKFIGEYPYHNRWWTSALSQDINRLCNSWEWGWISHTIWDDIKELCKNNIHYLSSSISVIYEEPKTLLCNGEYKSSCEQPNNEYPNSPCKFTEGNESSFSYGTCDGGTYQSYKSSSCYGTPTDPDFWSCFGVIRKGTELCSTRNNQWKISCERTCFYTKNGIINPSASACVGEIINKKWLTENPNENLATGEPWEQNKQQVQCWWSPGNCSSMNNNKSECNNTAGCTYKPASWETKNCSDLNSASSCNSESTCNWKYKYVACKDKDGTIVNDQYCIDNIGAKPTESTLCQDTPTYTGTRECKNWEVTCSDWNCNPNAIKPNCSHYTGTRSCSSSSCEGTYEDWGTCEWNIYNMDWSITDTCFHLTKNNKNLCIDAAGAGCKWNWNIKSCSTLSKTQCLEKMPDECDFSPSHAVCSNWNCNPDNRPNCNNTWNNEWWKSCYWCRNNKRTKASDYYCKDSNTYNGWWSYLDNTYIWSKNTPPPTSCNENNTHCDAWTWNSIMKCCVSWNCTWNNCPCI